MPRFVLLYHDCPPARELASHWDFMLEAGDVLRTWRLEQLPANWKSARERTAAKFDACPVLAAENMIVATQLGEHRHAYLDYEGEVSGGRGNVIRVSAGTYVMKLGSAERMECVLKSDSIAGHIVFERTTASENDWTLTAGLSS
jgi:hypothetical protein